MRLSVNKILLCNFYYCILYTLTRACLGVEFGQYPFYIYLGVMSLLIIVYFLSYKKQKQHIEKNGFYFGYFLFLVFILINIMAIPHATKYALYEYVFYLLMLFAVCYILNIASFEEILNFYEIMGVILSVEAIWEFVTGKMPYRSSVEIQIMRRSCGLVGTPLTLGMIFACIGLMSFYLGVEKNRKIHFVVFGLSIIGLLTTQSRGPIVGFTIGFLLMLVLNEYRKTGNFFNTVFVNILRILAIVVILVFIVVVLNGRNEFISTVYNRIQSILEWGGEDRSNELRVQRWNIGFDYFKRNPIFGYGVSSTGNHSGSGINVESGVIKKLAETGIVGFLMYYLTFGYTSIVCLRKCIKKKTKYYPVAFALIVAIFVENLVLQIIESASVFMIFIISFSYLFISSKHDLKQ